MWLLSSVIIKSSNWKPPQSANERRKLLALRILINLTIIGLFIGLFISIFIIYQKAPEWALNDQCQVGGFNLDNIEDQFSFDFVKCFWFEYLPSIVVTLANIAGPMMIFYLISYEKYEENTALLLSLGWCIFLRWEARRVYLEESKTRFLSVLVVFSY